MLAPEEFGSRGDDVGNEVDKLSSGLLEADGSLLDERDSDDSKAVEEGYLSMGDVSMPRDGLVRLVSESFCDGLE